MERRAPVDPFLALCAYVCGYQGSEPYIDILRLINTCLEVGAWRVVLMILAHLLSGQSTASPRFTPIPQRYIDRLKGICIIPPVRWMKEKLPVESYFLTYSTQTYTEKEGEETVTYTAFVPNVFGVVIFYETENGLARTGIVVRMTSIAGGYTATLADPELLEKMTEICLQRGTLHFTEEEQRLTPQEIKTLAKTQGRVERRRETEKKEEIEVTENIEIEMNEDIEL